MRRVASVWFPRWQTDRLRRRRPSGSAEAEAPPLVTVLHDGRRRVVAAVDGAAARLGLRAGMAVAQAQATVPGLEVVEAEPEGDAEALRRLALWCQRYTPLSCPCPPDGLWLEVGGSAHLFGGEATMLRHLLDRLRRDGLEARGAVADTPGAAFAVARHGAEAASVVGPGRQEAAVAGLPVSCLRLGGATVSVLGRLGFERVAHLVRVPRPVLARRFGPLPGLRLDQVLGVVEEPLEPLPPPQVLGRREGYAEPLLTADGLRAGAARLMGPLCREMEESGQGARRLDLLFERVDGRVVGLRAGTVQPSRDPVHLLRLLLERLDTVEPGAGVEAMRLVVSLAEPLRWEQADGRGGGTGDLARLVDRLNSRLGCERVFRAVPAEGAVPEALVRRGTGFGAEPGRGAAGAEPEPPAGAEPAAEAVRRAGPALRLVASAGELPADPPGRRGTVLRLVTAVAGGTTGAEEPAVLPWRPRQEGGDAVAPGSADHPRERGHRERTWPRHLRPPVRLLVPPCPVTAIAALPDEAPVSFTWRRKYLVLRSEGPERVHEAWWDGAGNSEQVREYFQVEVEGGQRFWLFRRGDGVELSTGTLCWFLHGVF